MGFIATLQAYRGHGVEYLSWVGVLFSFLMVGFLCFLRLVFCVGAEALIIHSTYEEIRSCTLTRGCRELTIGREMPGSCRVYHLTQFQV